MRENDDPKLCPLCCEKDNALLILRNPSMDADIPKQIESWKKTGLLAADVGAPSIEPLIGYCKERLCAWWDDPKQCCAVLTIARAARNK